MSRIQLAINVDDLEEAVGVDGDRPQHGLHQASIAKALLRRARVRLDPSQGFAPVKDFGKRVGFTPSRVRIPHPPAVRILRCPHPPLCSSDR
jgi:hypothetical protein